MGRPVGKKKERDCGLNGKEMGNFQALQMIPAPVPRSGIRVSKSIDQGMDDTRGGQTARGAWGDRELAKSELGALLLERRGIKYFPGLLPLRTIQRSNTRGGGAPQLVGIGVRKDGPRYSIL